MPPGFSGAGIDPGDRASRHTDRRSVSRNVAQHHGAAADLGVVPDIDRAKDFGTDTDHNAVAKRRVSLPALLARPAERHRLIQGDIVTNHGCLADDDAHAMVDEEPPSDGRSGLNLNTHYKAAEMGNEASQQRKTTTVQAGRDT